MYSIRTNQYYCPRERKVNQLEIHNQTDESSVIRLNRFKGYICCHPLYVSNWFELCYIVVTQYACLVEQCMSVVTHVT